MNKHNEVLTKMKPFCFYRPKDLVVSSTPEYNVLKSLVEGMMIDKIKDGVRTLYISKQRFLL